MATANFAIGSNPLALTHDANRIEGRTGHLVLIVASRADESPQADRPVGVMQHRSHEGHLIVGRGLCARTDVPLRLELSGRARITIAAIDADAVVAREPAALALAGHCLGGLVPTLVDGLHGELSNGNDLAASGWLDRLALALSAEVQKLPTGSLGTGDLFARADEFMRAEATRPDLRVIDIANGLGVQVQQVERVFRQRRTSALEHLMALRIEAARKAEAAGADDLDELAQQTGFYDAAHLKRCWRKVEERIVSVA